MQAMLWPMSCAAAEQAEARRSFTLFAALQTSFHLLRSPMLHELGRQLQLACETCTCCAAR